MERLVVLDGKLDKIQEDISEIKVTMATNTAHLEAHMARTAAVEKNNELIQEQIQIMSETLQPIKEHVLLVNYTISLVGAIFTGVLTLFGLYQAILFLLS